MQKRHALRDDQWEKVKYALPEKSEDLGRACKGNLRKLFVSLEFRQNSHCFTD